MAYPQTPVNNMALCKLQHLSSLPEVDSQLAKVNDDIAMSPYYNYYLYLTKISNFPLKRIL